MKHAIFGTVIFTISILIVIIVATISGRMMRKEEVNSTLTLALDQAVENVMMQHKYTIANEDEFISDVLEYLLYSYHSDSEIEIKIAEADYEKGILSIKAVAHYTNINGTPGTYEAEKTVIFEESVDVKYYTATYYNEDGTIYIQYKICSEDKCIAPEVNKPNGGEFKNWKYEGDDIDLNDINSIILVENLKFYPVFY